MSLTLPARLYCLASTIVTLGLTMVWLCSTSHCSCDGQILLGSTKKVWPPGARGPSSGIGGGECEHINLWGVGGGSRKFPHQAPCKELRAGGTTFFVEAAHSRPTSAFGHHRRVPRQILFRLRCRSSLAVESAATLATSFLRRRSMALVPLDRRARSGATSRDVRSAIRPNAR